MKPDASNDSRACPPCTGACNQSRDCQTQRELDTADVRGMEMLGVMLVLALALAFAVVLA